MYFLEPKYFFHIPPSKLALKKYSAVIHGQTDTIDTRKGQAFKATHISYIHNYTGLFSDILTQRKFK